MPNSHARQWRQDEDDQLIAWYAATGNEEELAQRLGRHPDDLWLRLWELLAPTILTALRQLDLQPPAPPDRT